MGDMLTSVCTSDFLPGWHVWGCSLVLMALKSVLLLVVLLLAVAYLLLLDRKVLAAVNTRRGPNVVGAFGLLQSFADLFKFAFKDTRLGA